MRDLVAKERGGYQMRGLANARRGSASGGLFSYVDLEVRIPADHPLWPIRATVDDALSALSGEFEALYSHLGRPAKAP
jgi:hypothetical protein